MFTFDLILNNTFYYDIELDATTDITIQARLSSYDNLPLEEMDSLTLEELDYTTGKGAVMTFDLILNNTFYFNI